MSKFDAVASVAELIRPYSVEALCEALANRYCKPEELSSKKIVSFLAAYLREAGAKTLVVEPDYIDADYLDDYATYYVRCYKPFDRLCKRLHFFRAEISPSEFQDAISSQEQPSFLKEYLGFIVARPLPDTVIGRTILESNPAVQGAEFPCTKSYDVNLFGLSLQIKRSLAFQEQDMVLAACATLALWSAFHKAAEEFHTPQPTPSAITTAATRAISDVRRFPSHDLSIYQITDAIRWVGLEPEVIPVRAGLPLLSILFGYMNLGIPPILIVEIGDQAHAVAVVGYKKDMSSLHQSEIGPRKGLPMAGLGLRSIFVHDDQFGPFCEWTVRMRTPRGITRRRSEVHPLRFIGLWTDKAGRAVRMIPKFVIVPIYHKIRLAFADLELWIASLEYVFQALPHTKVDRLWDITLVATNDLKENELRKLLSSEVKEQAVRVLISPHPRFAWRVLLRSAGIPIVELFADATAIAQSFPFYELIWHHPAVRDSIRSPDLIEPLKRALPRAMREFLTTDR